MTTTPDTLRPGYYVCVPTTPEAKALGTGPTVSEWEPPYWTGYGVGSKDPRTLGYTIHYLPDLLAAVKRAEMAENALDRIREIILHEHGPLEINDVLGIIDDNDPRPSTPQGEEKP